MLLSHTKDCLLKYFLSGGDWVVDEAFSQGESNVPLIQKYRSFIDEDVVREAWLEEGSQLVKQAISYWHQKNYTRLENAVIQQAESQIKKIKERKIETWESVFREAAVAQILAIENAARDVLKTKSVESIAKLAALSQTWNPSSDMASLITQCVQERGLITFPSLLFPQVLSVWIDKLDQQTLLNLLLQQKLPHATAQRALESKDDRTTLLRLYHEPSSDTILAFEPESGKHVMKLVD